MVEAQPLCKNTCVKEGGKGMFNLLLMSHLQLVACIVFAFISRSYTQTHETSVEHELKMLVEYTVQEVGLEQYMCKAGRGQTQGGVIDCSRFAAGLGAVTTTWLNGDGETAHKRPSPGQICKMFRSADAH